MAKSSKPSRNGRAPAKSESKAKPASRIAVGKERQSTAKLAARNPVATKPVATKPAPPKPAAPKPARPKWVYAFGGGKAEGRTQMRDLLGGKGANLAEMANLRLPVPPGFTITTEVCTYFYSHDKTYPTELKAEVETALVAVGNIAGGKV